jgi:acetyl-CoA C-acetyltransferase
VARSVRESIELAASPEEVWDVVMDPARLPEWVTTHDSLEGPAPGTLSAGDEFTQKLRLAGKSFTVRWRVVQADRPRLAVWEGDGPAGSSANVSYRLEAAGNGTRFEYENEFALPGGVLGKAAGGLLAAAPGSREARRTLANLKALLEE